MEQSGKSHLLPVGAGAALQLLAGNLLAAGLAVAVIVLATQRTAGTVALALLAGVLGGGLLGALLVRSLLVIALVLRRLARDMPVQSVGTAGHGLLAGLIGDLNAVVNRMAIQSDREAETEAFRDHLLEQVSAAAVQEERNRLARDLHDSIKQQIFSMNMSAAAARARWEHDPTGARTALADIERSAQEAQVEMAALLTQLRPAPLEGVGLYEALRVQCEALAYRTGADVELEPMNIPPEELTERLGAGGPAALFRIAQELLANIARHARARHVAVRIGQESGSILLRVRDDGQGFDQAGAGSGTGLDGIRERAQALGGRFAIESLPGQGTIAEVRLPLQVHTPAVSVRATSDDERRWQEERRKTLSSGVGAAQITAILIFLAAPIGAILLGTAVAAFCYGRSLLLGIQGRAVSSAAPADDGTRERQWGLLAGILGLIALAVWYLPAVQSSSRLHFGTWILLGLSLPLGLAALGALLVWYRERDLRLNVLPADERRQAIARRRREIGASLGLWLIIVLIAVFIAPPSPIVPPHSLDRWSDDAAIAILAVWPVIDAIDYLLADRRGRLLPRGR